MFFLTPDTGFYTGYYTVLKTTDGGLSYSNITPSRERLTGYWFSPTQFLNDSIGYLYEYYRGSRGNPQIDSFIIWKTTNCGNNWNIVLSDSGTDWWPVYPHNHHCLNFINSNYGYIIVPTDSNIIKTTDGGATWSTASVPGNIVYRLCFFDTLTGYAVNYQKIWKTIDGGGNWQLICAFDSSLHDFEIQFPVNYLTGYLCCLKNINGNYRYSLQKTTNGGYSWEQILLFGTNETFDKIFFVNNETGYISTCRDASYSCICKLFKTTNGRDFSRNSLPISSVESIDNLFFIKGTKTGYVECTDQEGNSYMLKTIDGGGESLGFWQQLTLIPEKPKKGVLLTYDPETYSLYLLEKGKSCKLWSYKITSDSWQLKKQSPVVFKDGAITYDGYGLSVLRYRTNECWQYDIDNEIWTNLPNIPGETLIKRGCCITSNWDNLLFVLKGNKVNEFWMFYKTINQWLRKPNIPGTPVRKGASIACDGEYVYAFKGGKTNEFWSYSIEGDSWQKMPEIPGFWIKDGSRLAANPYAEYKKLIFALKGSSQECWYYDVGLGYWKLVPGIPGRKKIKPGAQLTVDENSVLYAIKAKKLQEIWHTDELVFSSNQNFKPEEISNNIQADQEKPIELKSDFQISNPTKQIMLNLLPPDWISISLYDIMGKRIKTINKQTPSIELGEKLSQGIYFLRIKTTSTIQSKKLIVTR